VQHAAGSAAPVMGQRPLVTEYALSTQLKLDVPPGCEIVATSHPGFETILTRDAL
jgi:hypothetical protein